MSEALDRAKILSRCVGRKPKVEAVTLPDGDIVYVKVLDGHEADAFEQGNYEMDQQTGKVTFSTKNRRGRLAALCLCDANGVRLFPNDGEADMLGRMDMPTLDAIDTAAQRINGMDAESKRAKEKKSVPAEAGASGTASPATSA